MSNETIRHFVASAVILVAVTLAGCGGGEGGNGLSGGSVTGTGGSTARMVLDDDYLYAISGSNVQLFDVTAPATPLPWLDVRVDWSIETLFAYGDYLLVGAANGVFILDNRDRAAPTLVGEFLHATAIDPVVAQDSLAYVTLKRDSSLPGPGVDNQLNVVDISDVVNPELIETLQLQAPEGLAVFGNRLHICDGPAGLKTFDLEDPRLPVLLHVLPQIMCRDLIRTDDALIVISSSGLQQYDMTTGVPVIMSEMSTQPVIYRPDR